MLNFGGPYICVELMELAGQAILYKNLYHISGQHSIHYHGHFFHDSSKVKNRPSYNPL